MSISQLDHVNTTNKLHNLKISILCDDIRTPENIGMIYRVAEAFGVECIYLTVDCPDATNIKVKKTSRSTINQIQTEVVDDKIQLIQSLKAEQVQCAGIEITDSSKAIQLFKGKHEAKILLVLGSERNGIDVEVLNELDECYHIDMFGKNSSINVVNALSIALYELTK